MKIFLRWEPVSIAGGWRWTVRIKTSNIIRTIPLWMKGISISCSVNVQNQEITKITQENLLWYVDKCTLSKNIAFLRAHFIVSAH